MTSLPLSNARAANKAILVAVVKDCALVGLGIAQWIVSAHGGQIQIASQPEVKTTVAVRLPTAKAEVKAV